MIEPYVCKLHQCAAYHESSEQLQLRSERFSALLREGRPRDLSRAELAVLLPPRAPSGCLQNQWRGRVLRTLSRKKYTFNQMKLGVATLIENVEVPLAR